MTKPGPASASGEALSFTDQEVCSPKQEATWLDIPTLALLVQVWRMLPCLWCRLSQTLEHTQKILVNSPWPHADAHSTTGTTANAHDRGQVQLSACRSKLHTAYKLQQEVLAKGIVKAVRVV